MTKIGRVRTELVTIELALDAAESIAHDEKFLEVDTCDGGDIRAYYCHYCDARFDEECGGRIAKLHKKSCIWRKVQKIVKKETPRWITITGLINAQREIAKIDLDAIMKNAIKKAMKNAATPKA